MEFPTPVLALTADAVRELDGREALSGLWQLFTKCKESLHDGRRLENISWRLWYRELQATSPAAAKAFSRHNRMSTNDDSINLYTQTHTLVRTHTRMHTNDTTITAVTSISTTNNTTITDNDTAENSTSSALPSPLPSPSIPHEAPPAALALLVDSQSQLQLTSEPQTHLPSPSLSHSGSNVLSESDTLSHPQHPLQDQHPRQNPTQQHQDHEVYHSRHAPRSSFSSTLSASSSSTSGGSTLTQSSARSSSSSASSAFSERPRRSSFAGMSVGEIICDILPLGVDGLPMVRAVPLAKALAPAPAPVAMSVEMPIQKELRPMRWLPTPEAEAPDIQYPALSPNAGSAADSGSNADATMTATPNSGSNAGSSPHEAVVPEGETISVPGGEESGRSEPKVAQFAQELTAASPEQHVAFQLQSQPQHRAHSAGSSSSTTPTVQTPQQHMQPEPPMLVVVNPTPNLTPHPTPPSTPVLFNGGHWLMPPGVQARLGGSHHTQQQQQQQQQQSVAQPGTHISQHHQQVDPLDTTAPAPQPTNPHAFYNVPFAQIAPMLPPLTLPPPGALRSMHGPQAQMMGQMPAQMLGPGLVQGHTHIVMMPRHMAQEQGVVSDTAVGLGGAGAEHETRNSISSGSSSSRATSRSARSASSSSATSSSHTDSGPAQGSTVQDTDTPQSHTPSASTTQLAPLGPKHGLATTDGRSTRGIGVDNDDQALEEEEDDPLSPLPTVTSFGRVSPVQPPPGPRDPKRKRHSAPPPSTSDSTQMRLALSLSASSMALVAPPVEYTQPAAIQTHPEGLAMVTKGTPPASLARSRSSGSSRSTKSAGKRSSFSAAAAAGKRKLSSGAVVPAVAPMPPLVAPPPVSTYNNSTKSTTPATGPSKLPMGLTITAVTAAVVAAAAAAPPRAGRAAPRGKPKFSLGRAGNRKSAVALRRNSAGITGRARMKQKAKQEDDDEEDDEEEDEEGGDADEAGRAGAGGAEEDGNVDLGELDREVAAAQAGRAQREREARERLIAANAVREHEVERERMRAHEQARRAALAEEEKQRRRDLERAQRQADTLAALDAPTGDNVSETSSKRPVRFNIGSNSDDGHGGKSPGSNSDTGPPEAAAAPSGSKGKGKEREVDGAGIQQRVQHLPQPKQYTNHPTPAQQFALQHQLAAQLPPGAQLHLQNQMQRQLDSMEQVLMQRVGGGHQQQQARGTVAGTSKQTQQIERIGELAIDTRSEQTEQQAAAVSVLKNNGKHDAVLVATGVDDAMLAKVKDSLNAPLLPTGKKRVQLVTESESETDDEEDEDDWSSEEGEAVESAITAQHETERQLALQRQLHLQHQQHQLQQRYPHVRPQGVQRTHSSHYPAANNQRTKQQRILQQQQRQAQLLVDQAMWEAQRQKELFVKLPTSSFQDLAKARAGSVGLLTQLMNPDPEIFPLNHPYRRGLSSGEIRRNGISALQPMTPGPKPPTPAAAAAPEKPVLGQQAPPVDVKAAGPVEVAPAPIPTKSRPTVDRRKSTDATSIRSVFSPPLRSAGLAISRSAAALPVATQVQVGSSRNGHTTVAPRVDRPSALSQKIQVPGSGSGGYRPKGPPKDQEMDDDSDSDAPPIICSVAEQKLRALANRVGPAAAGKAQPRAPAAADDNDVPQWAKVSPHPPSQPQNVHGGPARRVPAGLQLTRMETVDPPQEHRPLATAPITLEYPYNLPAPQMPTTPRTTRRQMLSTEMSESLRRNLLWQRHSSKPNPAALRRTASAGHAAPLPMPPAFPTMVQLHAKGTKAEGSSLIETMEPLTKEERELARQQRMLRNKNHHDDFHIAGW